MLIMGIIFCCFGCSNNNEKKDNGSKNITITTWEKPLDDASDVTKAIYEAKMQRIRDKFPNVNIVDIADSGDSGYRQRYDKALMAGNAPTYYSRFSYTDIPTRIKNKTLADISEYVNKWELKKEDKVITQFDDAITSDDKWYAIPSEAYLQATLIHKGALRKSGVNVAKMPETWEEFSDLGQKVTDFSKPLIGYEIVGVNWTSWVYTAWVWSAGGDMVKTNDDSTYKITFNDEPGVDAACFLHDMIWKYKMTQKDILQDISKIYSDVKSGSVCFSWASIADFSNNDFEQYDLKMEDLSMMPMPVKDKSIKPPVLSGGEVYTFNPRATKEELDVAWDIVTYMNYDEDELKTQWKVNNDNKNCNIKMPGRKDLYKTKLDMLTFVPQKNKDELVDMGNNVIAEPFCPNWTELKSELNNPLQKIYLKENITRAEVKEILDECANSLYTKYPGSFKK